MIYLVAYRFGPYEGDLEVYVEVENELTSAHLEKCVDIFRKTLLDELDQYDQAIENFKVNGLYDDELEISMKQNIEFTKTKISYLDKNKEAFIASKQITFSLFCLCSTKIESVKL